MRALVTIVTVMIASTAFADAVGDALGRALGEVIGLSITGTTQLSGEASTRASTNNNPGEAAATRAECDASADCHSAYACVQGRCLASASVAAPRAAPVLPAPRGETGASCRDASDCGEGRRCGLYAVCEERVAPVVTECAADKHCGGGQSCLNNLCVSNPPPPSSSLRRRAAELYVRTRAVELREELALGRGAVIGGLAREEGVPAKKLGRVLREHRAELISLIGDTSNPEWSSRFLTRVEELCSRG